ncbi:MAG: DUF4857 domain-containing protein [Desulfovibrio sp.]|nr:DUF4857 domain-containing protein [Desulfovibrio sp.]
MHKIAFACLMAFSVCVLSWALPAGYAMVFVKPIEKTKLFYSPVLEKCIFTEQIRGLDPEAAAKSEGHHADIVYKDESGAYYDRLAFEAALPFIYYRNMEMRGLMPIKAGGGSFDRQAVEKARRVLELPARSLDGHRPETSCLPLIESNPGQAVLLYPDDRFLISPDGMEFVNADANALDAKLTELFTNALRDQGFVFPARHVGGNFTSFKPYEGGIFLVDARGALFHLLRRDGQPVCSKVALPAGVVPRHVLVSEAKERHWLGLVLDEAGRVWLLREGDKAFVGLEVRGYLPDSMDLKIIFNPLFATAVFSDESRIHAAVFHLPGSAVPSGTVLAPFHEWQHPMSCSMECWQTRLADALFPFAARLSAESSSLLQLEFSPSRHYWDSALPVCLLISLCWILVRRRQGTMDLWGWAGAVATALAGIHALVPLLLLDERG